MNAKRDSVKCIYPEAKCIRKQSIQTFNRIWLNNRINPFFFVWSVFFALPLNLKEERNIQADFPEHGKTNDNSAHIDLIWI